MAVTVMVSLHSTSWAQTQPPQRTSTLSGFVRDSSNGERLPNAAVAIAVESRAMGALSNAEGYYVIPDIPARTWVVTASYIGYTTHRDTLALTAGQALGISNWSDKRWRWGRSSWRPRRPRRKEK